jgi:RHS repeat-associated protein
LSGGVGLPSSKQPHTSTNTPTVTFKYSYDEVGNLTQTDELIANNITATTIYKYADPRYLNTEIVQTGTGLTAKTIKFSYDTTTGDNTKIDRYLDGLLVLSTTNAYDTHGRLKGITQRNSTGIIAQSTYGYDNLNRLASTTKNGQTQTYDYDSTDQVQTVTGSNSEAYTYDQNGNRTNSGYITDAGNRLRSDGTYNYKYDSEGNRTKRTKIADGTVDNYSWDYRNRLMGIVSKDINGVVTRAVGYTYDVDDQRVSKTVDGVVENYYLDRSQIAFVTDGGGHETFHYLYGLNIDQVLVQDSATGMIWALADRLGSVDTLTDAVGNVVDERTFDSFGRLISETNPAVSFRYGYTGRELDAESGLDYYRARYYDSAVGRFISVDPMGFGAGDTNLYRYVGNNSTNNTDPTGMFLQEAWNGAQQLWNNSIQGISNLGRGVVNTSNIAASAVGDFAYEAAVKIDRVGAGMTSFVTGGVSDKYREARFGGQIAGQSDSFEYALGQSLGFGITTVLSALAPQALLGRVGFSGRVAQGYAINQTWQGAYDTTTKIQNGQMDWSSPWSYVETVANFAPVLGAGARQLGKIGVVENAWSSVSQKVSPYLTKATAVADDIWNGVSSKLGKLNQAAGDLLSYSRNGWNKLGSEYALIDNLLSPGYVGNTFTRQVSDGFQHFMAASTSNLETAKNTFIQHFRNIGSRSDAKILKANNSGVIPASAQNRINIRTGRGDLSNSYRGSGLSYALGNHMNPSLVKKSQFTVDVKSLKEILRSPDVINSPVKVANISPTNTVGGYSFYREVNLGFNIGTVPRKVGGQIVHEPTTIITVLTDGFGNLKNTFPGKLYF